MDIRTIVVALDTSPRASLILKRAVDLARTFGSKLVLVRAVGIPLDLPPETLAVSPTKVPEILERIAREDLAARAATVPPELLGSTRVGTGVAWEVICRTGRDYWTHLIWSHAGSLRSDVAQGDRAAGSVLGCGGQSRPSIRDL